MRRAWLYAFLIFADCRRKHEPIAVDEPAPPAARDLSAAPADLSVAIAAPPSGPSAVRSRPPSADEVRAALRPALDEIARCVTHALPTVDAKLILRFDLSPAGRPTGARVEGVTGADSCVQRPLDSVRTPAFAGDPEHVAIPLGHDGRPIPIAIPIPDGGR